MSDFNEIINRRGTNCAKWDTMDKKYGGTHLTHLGVADMDFKAPDPISEALKKCAEHGIYGYTDASEKFYDGIIRWFRDKNNCSVRKELVFLPALQSCPIPRSKRKSSSIPPPTMR